MGHLHVIGKLPATRQWRQVIELIAGGADVNVIAAASSTAAEKSLIEAGDDPVPQHVFYLLTQLPLAANDPAFPTSLGALGIFVSGPVTPTKLCSGFVEAVDRMAMPARDRTDLGELVTLSAVETLSAALRRDQHELFGSAHEVAVLQTSLRRLSSADRFGDFTQDFFARLTRRYLDYYLSRELANHVGQAHRFHSIREHRAFQVALRQHCAETAEIVRQFASEWFSKRVYKGDLDEGAAGWALQHGFEKVCKELRIRRDAHA